MSGRGHHSGIGFGGAVGLGIAAALLITVIAIGHALGHQLTAAMGVVIVFAEVALCTLLAAAALAVVGLLAYRGQLARHDLAERRLGLEQLARKVYAVRAEVLEPGTAETPASQVPRPAILGKRGLNLPARHLEAVPSDDQGGAS
jgi:hypothetical protein